MNAETLTTRQACALTGWTRQTLARMVRDGSLKPAGMDGRSLTYARADLMALQLRICPVCGTTFTATTAKKLFCSHRCAVAAADQRKRDGTSVHRGKRLPDADALPERLKHLAR